MHARNGLESVAGTAARCVARYCTRRFIVDAAGRQGAARAAPLHQSLVAGAALRDGRAGSPVSPIPYRARSFQIDFDFIAHRLIIATSEGATETFSLRPQSVAEFHGRFHGAAARARYRGRTSGRCRWRLPIPSRSSRTSRTRRTTPSRPPVLAILLQVDRVFTEFRARFIGKVSPVHFFWGSFDHAVTRFSGRRAPPHGRAELADVITREAYSHEVSSCGFWPGGDGMEEAGVLFLRLSRSRKDFRHAGAAGRRVLHRDLGEFILPYDAVRTGVTRRTLLEFLQSTYEPAANSARWTGEPGSDPKTPMPPAGRCRVSGCGSAPAPQREEQADSRGSAGRTRAGNRRRWTGASSHSPSGFCTAASQAMPRATAG